MAARIEIEQGTDGWQFNVKSGNGAVVATGPRPYTTKGNARRAALRAVEAMKAILGVSRHGVSWPPEPPERLVP